MYVGTLLLFAQSVLFKFIVNCNLKWILMPNQLSLNIIAYFDLGVFANSQVLQTNQIIFLSHEPVGF